MWHYLGWAGGSTARAESWVVFLLCACTGTSRLQAENDDAEVLIRFGKLQCSESES
jgi:outer membrane biogenesis lipoprotein LolB